MARFTLTAPEGHQLPTDVVSYGADVAREDTLRLLGPLEGRRVLDLGCGGGHNAIALARSGAKVIGVDADAEQIAAARAAAEREGLRLELHHAPLAELAFVRADTVDACVSAFGLAQVDDLDRVFRQVDRVLKPEHSFVLSLPHPAFAVVDGDDPELRVRRSYWERTPQDGDLPRTIAEIFTSLGRANFRVDALIEPEPLATSPRSFSWSPAMAVLPATLILRARKQGS